MVYHILSYLPVRDLKAIRLVNPVLGDIGRKNVLWSELCRLKWADKRCLETIPVPAAPPASSEDQKNEKDAERNVLHAHLLSMKDFKDHVFDELVPQTLYNLALFFPAFHVVEGSWLAAYNLVEHHMNISYLHDTVRTNEYSISDTQWELYLPIILKKKGG